MNFHLQQLVTKLSVSDVLHSKEFYENVLGFTVDERYTISDGGTYSTNSYLEMNAPCAQGGSFTIGLYKDIDAPYPSMPANGTVPSFIVDDIKATLQDLLQQGVVVMPMGGGEGDDKYIISNTSDEGYVDLFFFFCDPDNNSLVIRQNMGKE